MRHRPAEILEILVAGILWAALVVGLSFAALTTPGYVAVSTRALAIAKTAGLSETDTVAMNERLRAFVSDQDPGTLPTFWRGRPAFDSAVLSHLEDVRRAIMGARVATGVAAALLAGYLGVCVALKRPRPLAGSMRVGAIAIAVVIVFGVAAGLLDFDSLFSRFHGLLFAEGTWLFPYDSLLIRLLPERFWVGAGAVWALLAATGALVLAITAHYVGSAAREEGGSRTGEDV